MGLTAKKCRTLVLDRQEIALVQHAAAGVACKLLVTICTLDILCTKRFEPN